MVDGQPDVIRFAEVIGAPVIELPVSTRALRYSENWHRCFAPMIRAR
jgi:hypothetical protein